MEERGTPVAHLPAVGKKPLDLWKLYIAVREIGGLAMVKYNVVVWAVDIWAEHTHTVNSCHSAYLIFSSKVHWSGAAYGVLVNIERSTPENKIHKVNLGQPVFLVCSEETPRVCRAACDKNVKHMKLCVLPVAGFYRKPRETGKCRTLRGQNLLDASHSKAMGIFMLL